MPENETPGGLSKEDVKGVVREVLSESIIPKGYFRCPDCGDLVKDGGKCLKHGAPEAENSGDEEATMLGI